jgi:hypothetical protein
MIADGLLENIGTEARRGVTEIRAIGFRPLFSINVQHHHRCWFLFDLSGQSGTAFCPACLPQPIMLADHTM